MILLKSASFDWHSLLLGEEEWSFLPEVLLRSAVMFAVTLVALRIIGKRGIMQGVFELVTIITLGSAAGDPMFYKKVGLLPATLVFACIVGMYRLTNYFVSRFKSFEHLVEGRHHLLIRQNRFVVENIHPEILSKDEIFADLRLKGITHLGQVRAAYIEASGELSVFFLRDEEVVYGLPVLPELYEAKSKKVEGQGTYSCAFCGNTRQMAALEEAHCELCRHDEWVASLNELRVT